MVDVNGKGYVTPLELRDLLLDLLGVAFSMQEIELFYKRYNKQRDNKFKYSDFTDALMPIDEHYSRLQGMKRMQYLYYNNFETETMNLYLQLWETMMKNEIEAERIKFKIS